MAIDPRLLPAFLRLISGRVFIREIMISKHGGDEGDRPVPTHETAAEQTREAKESEEAFSVGASNRERMVDIGRGNKQAGRQGQ
jgi:hypothetical protein